MKKIICLSGLLMLSVSLTSATNSYEKKLIHNEIDFKIEKFVEQTKNAEEVFFARYQGRCLDGHTFTFYADSPEQAQGYVNGYCAARNVPIQAPETP